MTDARMKMALEVFILMRRAGTLVADREKLACAVMRQQVAWSQTEDSDLARFISLLLTHELLAKESIR